jgi:hypothetical protein
MKKIVVVYHAFMHGNNYMEMMIEQCRLVLNTGLYQAASKIYIGVIESSTRSPIHGQEWLNSFWKSSSSKKEGELGKVEIVFYSENKEEAETLKWIRDYAKSNPGDYVLYFHTKGISKFSRATEDWRRYMEYFCVEQWRDCVQKLDEGYDCCGVMWNTHTPIGSHQHFSGNFWWANTDHINTLDNSFLEMNWRFYREFWIGNNPHTKQFEFHNSGLNNCESLIADKGHYNTLYPRSIYEKKFMKIHIICTVFERVKPMGRLIYEFILQTNPNWTMSIIHDGPAPQNLVLLIESFKDRRITFQATPQVNGFWGFPNRRKMVQEIQGDDKDYILCTNDDNQYLQVFIEYFLNQCKPDVGMVYCNTLHSYMGYDILHTEVRSHHIDMGSFIVRMDVAKKVGFNHQHEQADGAFAEECATECRGRRLKIVQINKALYAHN